MHNPLRKLKSLSKLPPFSIAKVLIDKIPGRPVQLERFYILVLSCPKPLKLKYFGTIREGSPGDIPGMCLLENKNPELFSKRFDKLEFCVVAENNVNEIIGYGWFSDKAEHVEESLEYRLAIPHDTFYAYDFFIKREYRIKGIWVVFQKYILDIASRLGRENIIATINFGNDLSLKTHVRFGYVVTSDVICVRLINKWIFHEKSFPLKMCTETNKPSKAAV
jgi:GNAT superfamily N-acetyltransferase